MAKKTPRPIGIPLESEFTDKHFLRNLKMLIREDPQIRDNRLLDAFAEELVKHAAGNVIANQNREKGGKTTAEIKQYQASQDKATIHKEADTLLKLGRGKREISSLIMRRFGFSRKKVLEALHSHSSNLWKK